MKQNVHYLLASVEFQNIAVPPILREDITHMAGAIKISNLNISSPETSGISGRVHLALASGLRVKAPNVRLNPENKIVTFGPLTPVLYRRAQALTPGRYLGV